MLEAMVSHGCLNYPTAGRLANKCRARLARAGYGPCVMLIIQSTARYLRPLTRVLKFSAAVGE
jgi:hypothetical protein